MPTDIQYERETTLIFNEAESDAEVWSSSPRFQRKMTKVGVEPYKTSESERGFRSCWYRVPRAWIKIRKPKELTEEQRREMAERGKALSRGRLGVEVTEEPPFPDQETSPEEKS